MNPETFALYHAYDPYHHYQILKAVSILSGITIHFQVRIVRLVSMV